MYAGLASGMTIFGGCTLKEFPLEDSVNLAAVFNNPPPESRPFFRWWWNGDRLSKPEIRRQLQVMKEAGMGGVEINPIAMPEQAQNLLEKPLLWLSDEWIAMLKYTQDEAHKLGLIVDLIIGTGWPFGGEFLDPDETIQGVKGEVTIVKGPTKKSIPLPKSVGKSTFKILQVVLYPENLYSLSQIIDLTDKVDPEKETLEADVPAGKYKLCVVTWQNHFRQVSHGAPGGAGPVLDHFNQKAVEKYLHHMSDRINDRLGQKLGSGIRALFCDSIELEGANWTGDFNEEFSRRRGYEILPYLPLLLDSTLKVSGEFTDIIKRVRFDQSTTLAELFMERFLMTYHKWCHENEAESRYQAYGYPWLYTDLIDGYLVPDIPEGDQWLFNGGWQPYCDVDQIRYAIWDKYASSAGHLAGRKIISAEAMTNTSGVFEATLAYIKEASDLNVVTGVNHHVLHGYNYSPPEAGFPGWIRFGCYFNEKNTWWPYFKYWTRYISRISGVMQASEPVSQVAIMGPTADIWSQAGLDRNVFNLQPWYLHCLWQALNHNGFGSDYVNGNILKNAMVKNGKITYGPMEYDLLLLCDVETISPEVAAIIKILAENGAKVVIMGNKPSRSPEMKNRVENDKRVQFAIEEALKSGLMKIDAPGENLQKSQQDFTNWTRQTMQKLAVNPGIQISDPDYCLFHFQQVDPTHKIFFFTNADRERILDFVATFPGKLQNLWKWDPEKGKREQVQISNNNEVPIQLNPLESLLLVSEKSSGKRQIKLNDKIVKRIPVAMAGSWELTCLPVHGDQFRLELHQLKDLSEEKNIAGFSGNIIYNNLAFLEDSIPDCIDLGIVYDIASLEINGKEAGVRWYGKKMFYIKDLVRKGDNKLTIKVTNTLFNYVRTLHDPVSDFWLSRSKTKNQLPTGMVGPLHWIYFF